MSPSSPRSAPAGSSLHPVAKAVLGGCVALGLLAMVEGGLRLAGIPDPGLYVGDPAWAWTLRPDLDLELPFEAGDSAFGLTTNALGLRGAAPPSSEPWTLALGCSTTFGWGVEDAEAWPAVLSELTGEAVVNGGVPGWSTAQALRAVRPYLELGPDRVVLAYIVRDAWPAARTDAQARPTPWFLRLHLAQAMGALRSPGDPAGPSVSPSDAAPTTRVPPEAYRASIAALVAAAAPAEVVLLAFPQPEDERLEPWKEGLRSQGPTLEPELPPEAYFPKDPVHLTAPGHRMLAEWLATQAPFAAP